jgi:NTP pyrophosphatase (non-canonical NTP hydrolase)
MSDLKSLTDKAIKFRDDRDWKQFHNPKDIAISLSLEAGEVLEHFQWKNQAEIEEHVQKNREAIGEELADVLLHLLIMSHDMNIDLPQAFEKKMKKNEKKYPVEKSKGNHKKYTEL